MISEMAKAAVAEKEDSVEEVLAANKRVYPFTHLFRGVKADLDNLNNQAEKIMSLFAQAETILKWRF